MASITLFTICTPIPGRSRKVEQVITDHSAYVKLNEPCTLRYEIIKDSKEEQPSIIVVQTHENQEALRVHMAAPEYNEMWWKLNNGGLLAGKPQVFQASPLAELERSAIGHCRRRSRAADFDIEF